MISNNRADYGSASEWLSALKQDDVWLSQQQRLETSSANDIQTHRSEALRRIGSGEAFEFWEIYGHQVESVVEEVWEIAELSLPKLKIQTIGMLSLEWIEQHTGTREQISEKPKSPSPKKKVKAVKPKTLKYYKHGDKGVLKAQRKRVAIVFRKLNEWGWIDKNTRSEDFDAFFEGNPRHCNITWTANNTILTILLQKLLRQPYIEKQKGCAAKSMVEQQFGKTANSDRKRLDEDAETRINIILCILNTSNPLPEPRRRDTEEEFDIRDAALQEIYSGRLRSTKGI